MKYAWHDGSAWQFQVVESSAGCSDFAYISLDLESTSSPHISYLTTWNLLKHAWNEGGGWQNETVDVGGQVGWYLSMALDSHDQPHLSYFDEINDDLRYAHYDGSTWQTEMVDGSGDIGRDTSLAVDPYDRPHISYHDTTNGLLKYAELTGASWEITTVDISTGNDTSLALDWAGNPHIIYRQEGLRHAYYGGSSWHIETVDPNESVGAYSSLALDTVGQPHVSYLDCTLGHLKYAHYDGFGWQIETVDTSAGAWGGYTSLALDTLGHPHISYYAWLSETLKYAYHDGADWQIETVTAVSHPAPTSLALDAAGRPRIAYYSWGALWLASWTGAGWQLEMVDGSVGSDSSARASLALDAVGLPHVAYFDAINGDPKYAWPCVGIDNVSIIGPASAPMGVPQSFQASYAPLTATIPMTFTWDNGTTGPTAVYTWHVTGGHTLAVTGTNRCSLVQDAVTVTVFCQPIEGVAVTGPLALLVGQTGTYQATPQPITASVPFTFTWNNATVGPVAAYSWTLTGTYAVTVTGTNDCGLASRSLTVRVLEEWPYSVCLPLILRRW